MATSSFFYNGASAPDQNTVAELIADLEAKVAAAQEATNAAVLAAAQAQAASGSAGASEAAVQSILVQSQAALASAQVAQASAEAALAAAQAAIVTTNNNVSATNAAKVAAQAAQALAETAEANAELAETNAETAQAAAQASATAASGSATSASTSASTATTQAGIATTKASEAATSATNASNSASAASTSATNASNSASAAASSATSAAGSATTATTKASEAASSASAAASSASASSTSASNASTSATNAASSASAASTSATNAANSASTATTQASNAATSASAALTSQNAAATSASNAATSATNAASSATAASNSATAASSAQTAAEAARDATLAAYDNFDDRYLGAKASDPTLDNDGNALVAGAIYFNTTIGGMKVYTGSAWVAAYISGSGYLQSSNNLSDLANAATARTNLGLGTAATQNSTAFATAAQGTKADTAVQPGSLATVATSGSYNDLSNKPTIPTVPTTVSSFTNDSGYITRTVSVNDTSDGLRITQTGTGNALVVEDSANPDSTPFIIDNAGNVGVGTSTMVAKMNVANTFDSVLIQATNGTVGHRVSYILSGVAYTGTSNAYPLSLMTVGTEAMRIDTSQRVGIGTTSTLGNSLLNVAQGVVARNVSTTLPYFQTYNANAGVDLKTWRWGGNSSGALAFETVNDAYSAANERMRIDSSGNVGIGTSSPSQRLHVAGEQLIQPTTVSNAKLSMRHGSLSANNYFETDSSANTIFGTNNAERMRIDSSGNVLIGNSTDPLGSNRLLVQSAGTSNFNRTFSVYNTAATSTTAFANRLVQISSSGSGADATLHFSDQVLYNAYLGMGSGALYFATNGTTERMRIDASGNVGIGTTTPSSFGTRLAVSGAANVYGDERKVVTLIDTTALAAGVGAGISFWGVSESGGGTSQFGSIKGIKENATSANYAGALAFVTSNSSNAQTERMRITSTGNVGIGTASPANPLEVTQANSSTVAGLKVSGPTWVSLDLVTTNADSGARNWRLAGVLNSFGRFEIVSGSSSGGAPDTTVFGVSKGSSIALEGATPKTGTGITFPATQSASSDANTLDDYEEGTFTPSLTFGGNSTGITYSWRYGNYTKVGNKVTCQFAFGISSKGSSTGDARVAGFPFTSKNITGSFSYIPGGSYSGNFATVYVTIESGVTSFILNREDGTATNMTTMTDANFTNVTRIACTITYFTE